MMWHQIDIRQQIYAIHLIGIDAIPPEEDPIETTIVGDTIVHSAYALSICNNPNLLDNMFANFENPRIFAENRHKIWVIIGCKVSKMNYFHPTKFLAKVLLEESEYLFYELMNCWHDLEVYSVETEQLLWKIGRYKYRAARFGFLRTFDSVDYFGSLGSRVVAL